MMQNYNVNVPVMKGIPTAQTSHTIKPKRNCGKRLTCSKPAIRCSVAHSCKKKVQKELQWRNTETGAVPNGQADADAPPEREQFNRRRR